ncbi:MAG: ComEC/Rec2 family competence protein [Rhizobiaceae bacterium]|nr:ComEC/Rec2 family competence protein [Rhizobiaceae bacterium]MCV0407189.1 ComEC/Rec2 family competence protein [Rhizobiaceae bacterium]
MAGMAGSERSGLEVTLERRLFDAPATEPAPDGQVPATVRDGVLAHGPANGSRRRRPRRARAKLAGVLEEEVERGALFLLIPIALGIGALGYFLLPVEPAWPIAAACPAVAGLAAFVMRERLVAGRVLLGVALVLAGLLAAKLETWRASTPMLGSAVITRLTGEVEAIETMATGRVRLTLTVMSTARPALRHAPDRVRLSAASAPDGLTVGSVVEGVARLFPPSGPLRPSSYDFAFESYFDGRGATGFYYGNPEIVDDQAQAGPVEHARLFIERTRMAIAERIRAVIGGRSGEIAAALVVGIRGGIPEEANEALRKTGLAHVLSISGLHMALVAFTVMFAIRLGFALFPNVASRWPVKKIAAAAALTVAALYLSVSGAQVAAQRAFIMLAVMLGALLFDQAAITMRNLAIAAIVILVMSPHEIVGPSFQMSFAATAALIAGYAAWGERRAARLEAGRATAPRWPTAAKLRRYAFGLAATSVIAGLATTIYGVWHFQRVSPLSLFANLAAMPLVGVMVMPFAVFAMVLMPFGLDWLPLKVMGTGIEWLLRIADWFAARTPLDAVGQIPPSSVALLTLGLLAAAVSSTWLRLLGLPFAIAGLALIAARDLPDVYVSEDARLVGVRTSAGALAVNRGRPNRFTVDNWLRAANAKDIVAPGAEGGFRCADDACVFETDDGALIVHAKDETAAVRHCAGAVLVVIEDATATRGCGAAVAMIVTGRDLARRGSAAVRLSRGRADVTFSIREPFRPWHEHRRHSREARGLAPWRRGEDRTDDPDD